MWICNTSYIFIFAGFQCSNCSNHLCDLWLEHCIYTYLYIAKNYSVVKKTGQTRLLFYVNSVNISAGFGWRSMTPRSAEIWRVIDSFYGDEKYVFCGRRDFLAHAFMKCFWSLLQLVWRRVPNWVPWSQCFPETGFAASTKVRKDCSAQCNMNHGTKIKVWNAKLRMGNCRKPFKMFISIHFLLNKPATTQLLEVSRAKKKSETMEPQAVHTMQHQIFWMEATGQRQLPWPLTVAENSIARKFQRPSSAENQYGPVHKKRLYHMIQSIYMNIVFIHI